MEDDSTEKLAELRGMLADKESPSLEEAARLALTDEKALGEILDGIVSKDDTYRYNCFKVLHQISEEQPLRLYSEWGYSVELMSSSNSYHRSIALQIIANLTSADEENRFEEVFDRYFDLLDDEKVITARYLARSAGKIARSKPHLRAGITERLLRIDETHHSQGRKDLMKADVIQSFDEFFEDSDDKERILAFVEEQLACSSPKTRKAARAFLGKYSQGGDE